MKEVLGKTTLLRKSLIALLLLAASYSSAQPRTGTWSLVPRLGISFANMSGSDLDFSGSSGTITSESKMRAGVTAGLDLEWQATNNVGFSIGALYSTQGCKYKDVAVLTSQTDEEAYYTLYSDMKYDMQYVNIPLLASFYPFRNFAIKAGIQFDIPFYTKYKEKTVGMNIEKESSHKTYSDDYSSQTNDVQNIYKQAGVSIPIAISYEYENVIIDLRYNIGLTDICKTSVQRNKVIALTVGYRLAFFQ